MQVPLAGASKATAFVCGAPHLALGIIFADPVLPLRLNAPRVPVMLFLVVSVGCVRSYGDLKLHRPGPTHDLGPHA